MTASFEKKRERLQRSSLTGLVPSLLSLALAPSQQMRRGQTAIVAAPYGGEMNSATSS